MPEENKVPESAPQPGQAPPPAKQVLMTLPLAEAHRYLFTQCGFAANGPVTTWSQDNCVDMIVYAAASIYGFPPTSPETQRFMELLSFKGLGANSAQWVQWAESDKGGKLPFARVKRETSSDIASRLKRLAGIAS